MNFIQIKPWGMIFILSLLLNCNGIVTAQMVSGVNIPGFGETMGVDIKDTKNNYTVTFINSSAPASVLWTGEQASFTFQLVNASKVPIEIKGKVDLISYGTKGRPNDIWVPDMYKMADCGSVPVDVKMAVGGYQTITVNPKVPLKNGAYALVIDLGELGRRFITSFIRTFKANPKPVQFPQLCLDNGEVDLLVRLGASPNRMGFGYKPTTDKDYPEWYKRMGEQLMALKKANLAITVEFGGGAFYGSTQPLGRPRPWLNDKGEMLDTKFDLAWTPSYDEDFKKVVKQFAVDYGWPKGPINAMKFMNEPWNGISISGWGADDIRYREIFTAMAQGVEEARKEANVEILLGGCDSSSNTFDKFFGDGTDEYLKWLDFCSIHYQGMAPPSIVKAWMNRKSPNGRVRIWDTESWVANTDDRVSAVVATNLSTGHDRAVGVYGGNIADAREMYWQAVDIYGEDGKKKRIQTGNTWSVAASVGATTYFIGERRFKELLFKNGLPWVMLFDGNLNDGKVNIEDSTVVVIGDFGEEFGADNVLFRTARGIAEIKNKADLRAKLAALPKDALPEVKMKIEKALATPEALSGATLTIKSSRNYSLYDFYGNPVASKGGKIIIPLDHRGFFLRGNGKRGSFDSLVKALQKGKITGIEPLAKECLDLTSRIEQHPTLQMRLTNVLNRQISGKLNITLGKLTLETPIQKIKFNANETKTINIKVIGGVSVENNTYPLQCVFDAGKDGKSEHNEDLHVNVIAKRTIAVDGKLDDWSDIPVQTVTSPGNASPTLQEFAWQPFKTFDNSLKKGYATGWLSYDKDYLYFSCKAVDNTVEEGMRRYETIKEDDFFYPEKSYAKIDVKGTAISVRWKGKVTPKFSEEYTFSTVTDDGARLWVNGQQLVDDWNGHGDTENSGTIKLEAGKAYDIKFEYYDGGGGATSRLLWTSPSQKKEVIPSVALTPDVESKITGLTGFYFRGNTLSGVPVTRIDNIVDFHLNQKNTPADLWTATEIMEEYTWPEGVRRYSYRMDPDLPAGNFPNHDNIQIAFNVIPDADKPWAMNPPGTLPKFTGYWDTDYEYALNPVAAKYGGGTEIWPLRRPDLPNKHYYPHSPKAPNEGPVKGGKLVIIHEGNTRIAECALPWSEIPDVKKSLDAGKTIKFSYRVNDNAGADCMELSYKRSVAKRNGSFKVDWVEHWANELEFAFEK
jgi:hypothetical protein